MVNLIAFLFVFLSVCWPQVSGFSRVSSTQRSLVPECNQKQQQSGARYFKKASDDNKGSAPWWSSWKSRLANLFAEPSTDSGNRYHIRIKNLQNLPKRHVTTRLMRYFPDLTWETAEDIVETALVNEIALVRVMNSLREAEVSVDMLRKSDPPIPTEIYDSRTDEVLTV